jgi:hypothetical protein
MDIITIVGLPASGKSNLISLMFSGDNFLVYDDPKPAVRTDLINKLNQAKYERSEEVAFVIADPYLCLPKLRENYIKFITNDGMQDSKVNLIWMYFKNDPEQCLINAQKRNEEIEKKNAEVKYNPRRTQELKPLKDVAKFIKLLSEHYTIPDGVPALEVYGRISN